MAGDNQDDWWRRTKSLAVASLGGAGMLAFFLLVFGPALDHVRFLGLPLSAFLVATGLPVILVAIVFWYAARQAEVDRRHGYSED